MFFVLSKTLSIVLEPLLHPFLLLLAAFLARLMKRHRLKKACLVLAIFLPLAYGFLPLSQAGLMVLENRFPIPVLADRPVDGIIILGGHTDSGLVSEQRNQPQQGSAAERLTIGLALHRRYPTVPLVFSGFSGHLVPRGWNEEEIIRRLLAELGISTDRILFEDKSRNTFENGVNSRALVLPQTGARWILVTSASHMPRSIGAFEAAGWRGLIPYPVDYRTGTKINDYYSLSDGVDNMRTMLHEFAGLVMYRLTGRSTAFLPGT